MKKMSEDNYEMKDEYRFDYSKSRPNRFAKEYNKMKRSVLLDSDVADYFPTTESVNEALRSIVKNVSKNQPELTHK